jgi:nicotinamide riboside kinase
MRINLFGGPGVGKSRLASWLFSQLNSHKIEYVSEYVKEWAWAKQIPDSWDQFHIFATQLHKEDKILRHGIHIISDSPLLLQITYSIRVNCQFVEDCLSLVRKFETQYPSLNIYLTREVPYDPNGRYEGLEEAKVMDKMIFDLLKENLSYRVFSPFQKEEILHYIQEQL